MPEGIAIIDPNLIGHAITIGQRTGKPPGDVISDALRTYFTLGTMLALLLPVAAAQQMQAMPDQVDKPIEEPGEDPEAFRERMKREAGSTANGKSDVPAPVEGDEGAP